MANKKETEHGAKASGAHVNKETERLQEQQRAERAARQERQQAEKAAAAEARRTAREAKQAQRRQKAKDAAPTRKAAVRTLLIVVVVAALLAAGLIGAAAYAGYRVTNNGVNFPNVYVEGIAVGGLTQEETLKTLNAQGWDEQANTPLTVTLPQGIIFRIDRLKAGAAYTAEAAAYAAYRYGHSDNWLENLLRYVENHVSPVDMGQDYVALDEDYIRTEAEKGIRNFQRKTRAQDYVIDREAEMLSLIKGAGEMEIDPDKLTQAICQALLDEQTRLVYDHIDNELKMPDFQALLDELAVEPEDAHFVEGGWEVVEEVVGCSFDLEQAQALWTAAAPYEKVEIPLIITYPEVTAEVLEGMLFRDKLGSQTTYYGSSSANRVNNIALAASKLNGLILAPGETFSYNAAIGQRTKEAGFLEAGAYANGEVVQEVGGGICQVSSTLYCAVMFANLETVYRESHYFRVDYLPIGYDATVSWPNPDFKFRNNRDYPVKIVANADTANRSLTIEIWGTDVDGSYVELSYEQYVLYDDKYDWVVVGWAAQTWRTVYAADGSYLATIKEPYSTYHKHEEDIEWPEESTEDPVTPVSGGGESSGGESSGGESSGGQSPGGESGGDGDSSATIIME